MSDPNDQNRSPRNGPPAVEPEIWGYRDARAFLGDLCDFKRAHEPGFSYRKLSRYAELGSPNYLQMYIRGKRNIKPATAAQIAEGLGLDEHESRFFVTLTQFTHAEDPDERAGWYKELLEMAVRFGGTGRIDAARLKYFTHWYIPLVHAMASLKGFRPDSHWIAARTVPKIRSFDAKKALDVLAELEIFTTGEDGAFAVAEPRLETDDELRSIWIREYHRAMIGLSEQALDAWDADERLHSALTVTVAKEQIPEVLARVDAFRKELFSWLMREQEPMDTVEGEIMQINFQAYRLTDLEGCE